MKESAQEYRARESVRVREDEADKRHDEKDRGVYVWTRQGKRGGGGQGWGGG